MNKHFSTAKRRRGKPTSRTNVYIEKAKALKDADVLDKPLTRRTNIYIEKVKALKDADVPVVRRKPQTRRTNIYIEKAKALKDADLPVVRLLDKPTVIAIANASFPTIWQWMRDGKFPRSRTVGGRSMWLSNEITDWLKGLPVVPLKGDASDEAA